MTIVLPNAIRLGEHSRTELQTKLLQQSISLWHVENHVRIGLCVSQDSESPGSTAEAMSILQDRAAALLESEKVPDARMKLVNVSLPLGKSTTTSLLSLGWGLGAELVTPFKLLAMLEQGWIVLPATSASRCFCLVVCTGYQHAQQSPASGQHAFREDRDSEDTECSLQWVSDISASLEPQSMSRSLESYEITLGTKQSRKFASHI